MSLIEHEIKQWKGRKVMRQFGQGTLKRINIERKNITVAGIKEKYRKCSFVNS
jgi:hypothetical protein